MRTTTSRRYGRTGAIWATVTLVSSCRKPVGSSTTPAAASALPMETSSATATVCTTPMRIEATRAPLSEPSPPMTTTTNTMLPSTCAMPGNVPSTGPAITPASPASAQPMPKTTMNTRGTLWPSIATIPGCVSEAWMMSPARVRVRIANRKTNMPTETASMNAL
jgi:hypothetical protein